MKRLGLAMVLVLACAIPVSARWAVCLKGTHTIGVDRGRVYKCRKCIIGQEPPGMNPPPNCRRFGTYGQAMQYYKLQNCCD